MGSPDLMSLEFVGPSTCTVPLSAPPRTTSIDGLTEPLGMSAGLSITDFLNCTVRSKLPPFFLALIWMGEVAFFSPMGDWQVYGMSTSLPVKSLWSLPVPSLAEADADGEDDCEAESVGSGVVLDELPPPGDT